MYVNIELGFYNVYKVIIVIIITKISKKITPALSRAALVLSGGPLTYIEFL